MSYLQDPRLNKQGRGDRVRAVRLPGRRVTMSRVISARMFKRKSDRRGFTLIELVITITVLTILTMGVVPLLKLSVKRQKEQQLRAVLRQMRTAIDEFHRDTVGMGCPTPVPGLVDPRSKVQISDCTIFGIDNPDRYPPDLETLVNGVNVIPRPPLAGGPLPQASTKKKVYLRVIPIDPVTGKAEWDLRSCYDTGDSESWGGENVFDVRSKSKETALNGEKYSDW